MGLGFRLFAEDMASAVFEKAGKSLQTLENQGQKFDLAGVGNELSSMGKKLTVMGLAGAAGLGAAASAAADFEKSVNLVRTIANASEFPLERIRDLGFSMAEAYGGDLAQQMGALYNAIGSGAETAAEGTTLLTYANKLAVAGATTVDAAMAGLTGTLNSYGMKMTEAAKVSDAYFAAVKLGAADMTVEVLAKQFAGVSGMASAMGVNLNEALGSIARITSVGTNTSIAVTQLKSVIEGIIRPSAEAGKEAQRLGITFDQATLKSKGLMGVLMSVQNSANFNSESFKKLFASSEALLGVTNLMSDGGARLTEMVNEMNASAGATDKAFATMAGGAAFAGAMLKANLQQALVKVGEVVMPMIGAVLRGMNAVVVVFNNLPGPVRQGLIVFVALASAMLVVAGVVLTAVGGLLALVAVGEAAAIAFGATIAVTQGVIAAFGLLYAAGSALRMGMEKNLGGVGEFFSSWYDRARLAYAALTQLVNDGKFSGAVLNDLDKAGNEGVEGFAIQLAMVVERVRNFGRNIAAGFQETFGGLGPTFTQLRSALESLLSALGMTGDGVTTSARAFDQYGAAGKSVGSALATGLGVVVQVLTSGINLGRRFIEGLREYAPTFTAARQAALGLVSALGTMFSAIGGASGSVDTQGSALEKFFTKIGGAAGIVLQAVTAFVSLATIIVSVFGAAISGVIGIVGGLYTAFSGIFNIMGGLLTGDFTQAWMGVKQVIVGVVQVVMAAVMALASAIAGLVDSMGAIAGKDYGFQAKVETMKSTALVGLKESFGLQEHTAPTPVAPKPYQLQALPGPAGAAAQPLPVAATGAGGAGATMPAVAATGAAGASGAGLGELVAKLNQPPPPLNVNLTSNLTVDGQVLANVVEQHSTSNASRGFAPTPSPTGLRHARVP